MTDDRRGCRTDTGGRMQREKEIRR